MAVYTETKTSSTSEGESEVIISAPRGGMMAPLGKISSIVSLVAGCCALMFASAPFVIGWFAAIFWMLYPCVALSLVAAIPAFFFSGKWRPIVGLCLSVTAILIAVLFGGYYVLALAGSVNGLTRIAKAFVDALTWPF